MIWRIYIAKNLFLILNLETDETMIENGDGVGMSNWFFCQDNQIPNTTQDTPKLCISDSKWQ